MNLFDPPMEIEYKLKAMLNLLCVNNQGESETDTIIAGLTLWVTDSCYLTEKFIIY